MIKSHLNLRCPYLAEMVVSVLFLFLMVFQSLTGSSDAPTFLRFDSLAAGKLASIRQRFTSREPLLGMFQVLMNETLFCGSHQLYQLSTGEGHSSAASNRHASTNPQVTEWRPV